MHARITVALVERLARDKPEQRLLIYDTELTGFQVRQSPTGAIAFYARAWVNGRQRCPKIGAHPAMTVPMARNRAAEILNGAQRGLDPTEARRQAKGEMTLSEMWPLYIADLGRRRRSRGTVDDYTSRWERYVSRLGKLRLSEVTHERVTELHDSILATAEADMVVRLIRAMLNWAMLPQRQYLVAPINPARGVEMKHRKPKRQRAMPVEKIEILAEAMRRWRAGTIAQRRTVWFLELLALTGARRDEIRLARPEHLRDGDTCLAVPENKEQNPDKVLTLGSAARLILQEVKAAAFGEYLFSSYMHADRPMAPPYQRAMDLFAEAGVEWTGFHGMRHTFASVARARNLDLNSIAELLGHADPAMTRIYAQAYEEARRRHAESVDEAVGRALGRRR